VTGRAAIATILGLALAAPVGVARADDDPPGSDYDVDSSSWNGLSRLAATAQGLNLGVAVDTELRWDQLGSGDILFILYPINRLDSSRLSTFLRNGGRVLVADDFGDASEAFDRLGLVRQQVAAVDAARFAADRPYAPVATARRPDHPLARGVDELITNHPAVFTDVSSGDTVFGFADGEAVVVAGSRGGGRFVALSDPSVLINRMLEYEGNLRFAINTLRWLGKPGVSDRLVIVTGDFTSSGEPAHHDDGTAGGRVDAMMGDLNDWLYERNNYLLTRNGLVVLSVLIAMALAALAALAVPGRRRTDLDGSWTRAAPAGRPTGDFESLVGYFDAKGRRASFLFPAAVLRDHVNTRLAQLLGRPEPLFASSADGLRDEIRRHAGDRAMEAFELVERRLRALPTRMQAASPWSVGYLSAREFDQLCRDVDEFERTLPPRKG